jgi:Ankyrin repeats (3 copies)
MSIWCRRVIACLLLACVLVGWLLASFFRISVEDELGGPPFDPVVFLIETRGTLSEIKGALAASGRGVNDIEQRGQSLLTMAVLAEREDVAAWLLGEGANPDGSHPALAPLAYAVTGDSVSLVRLLLEYGADPDLDMGDEITPRWIAVTTSRGNDEIRQVMEDALSKDAP